MDTKKLKDYVIESITIFMIIIIFSFIFYRIGVWRGENNMAIKYDIKSDTTYYDSEGNEVRIPFRLFD